MRSFPAVPTSVPQLASVIFLTLLWLNPFAPGPSPAVMPGLVSMVSASTAALLMAGAFSQNLARSTAQAWLAAALLSSMFAQFQYLGASAQLSPWVNTSAVGEAFANLRQRNQFSSLTNIGLVALFWWLIQGGSRAVKPQGLDSTGPSGCRPSALVSGVLILATVLLSAGNAASSSRTGLMQLLMLAGLAWWWGGWRQPFTRRGVFVALLAYAVASIALPLLIGRELGASGILARLHEGDPTCSSRITLWGNVLHLISQKPWFGWGWGELDFAHFITLYPGPRFCEILDNAHNLPLHLAVELGIPAALLICGTGLWLVWRAQPWRERDPTRQMAWGVLAVILLHSMLEYPLWYGPFQMAFGICILLLWRTPALHGVNSVEEAVPAAIKVPIDPFTLVIIRCIAIITIAFAAYAAWDYHRISQIYLAPAARDEAYRTNTLAKIKDSWLFRNQVQFAELTTTAPNADNAPRLNKMAHELLHFSPEARVVEKLIDSAELLGLAQEVEFFKLRYQAAFAGQYQKWVKEHTQP